MEERRDIVSVFCFSPAEIFSDIPELTD